MFELARKNRTRSAWLVSLMFGLLIAIGYVAAEMIAPGTGPAGVALAALVALALFLVSYYRGSSILLSAAGAHLVSKEGAPQLCNVVEEMVIAAGLSSVPKVYVIESNVANAFATGRRPEVSAVAVTEGLLHLCSRDELQAVIAHEIAHVKHRDILYMTLLAVMAGAIALIAEVLTRGYVRFGGTRRSSRSLSSGGGAQAQIIIVVVGLVLLILGAIAARVVFFAASRSREYLADAGSAIFTRNPAALASALEKISGNAFGNKLPVPKVAQPLLIVGASLFESHPPVDKRIAILRRLAGTPSLSYERYASAYRVEIGSRARFFPKSALFEPALPKVFPEGASQAGIGPEKMNVPFFRRTALRREALDALKKQAGYEIVSCPCGARIKIPQNYPSRSKIRCLSCGRPV